MREVRRDEAGLLWAKIEMEGSNRPVKVGAAVVASAGELYGLGCNSLPHQLADMPGPHSRTVHAEIMAIFDAGPRAIPNNSTLYVTCPVCHHCAPIVIHAGISRVVTLPPPDGLADWYEASFAAARAMFAEAGVECVEVVE